MKYNEISLSFLFIFLIEFPRRKALFLGLHRLLKFLLLNAYLDWVIFLIYISKQSNIAIASPNSVLSML